MSSFFSYVGLVVYDYLVSFQYRVDKILSYYPIEFSLDMGTNTHAFAWTCTCAHALKRGVTNLRHVNTDIVEMRYGIRLHGLRLQP